MSDLKTTVMLPINPPDEYSRRLNQAISDMVRKTALAIKSKADSAQPGWSALTPLNGWAAGRALAVRVSTTGQVNIRGSAGGGTMSQPIAILPANARPAATLTVPVVSGAGFGAVDIYPTGEIVPTVGTNVAVYLDGVSFSAS